MIFETLSQMLSDEISLSIAVSGKQEELTVTVTPVGKNKYPPLVFSGTAQEIDGEFIPEVQKAIGEANNRKLFTNAGTYAKEVEQSKETEKKPDTKASQPPAKGSDKKDDKKAAAGKPATASAAALAGKGKADPKKTTTEPATTTVVPEATTTEPATTTEQPQATGEDLSFEPVVTEPTNDTTNPEPVQEQHGTFTEEDDEDQPTLF